MTIIRLIPEQAFARQLEATSWPAAALADDEVARTIEPMLFSYAEEGLRHLGLPKHKEATQGKG